MTTLMSTSPAGKNTSGETEKGRGREETDPGRDVVVDLESEITEDPRMIAGEADPKNENPRSKKNERRRGRGSMRGMKGQARNSRTLISQLKNHKRNLPEGSAMKIRP